MQSGYGQIALGHGLAAIVPKGIFRGNFGARMGVANDNQVDNSGNFRRFCRLDLGGATCHGGIGSGT